MLFQIKIENSYPAEANSPHSSGPPGLCAGDTSGLDLVPVGGGAILLPLAGGGSKIPGAPVRPPLLVRDDSPPSFF